MGIIRIGMVVDEVKEALCYDLRHSVVERGEQKSKWDITSEDQKTEMCGKCPLAWNNASCEGRFGPNYSSLPNFAKRFGCEIVAGIPRSYDEHRMFSSDNAQRLLAEVKILRDKLKFEEDTVYVAQEQENLPEEKIEQWLLYTVGFEGVTTRKINASRVHEGTLSQLEKMANTSDKYHCSFVFF
ncbi:MAG: hypothetical protein WED05_00645 [Candidatus Atabeyarchaeum deiterrae]